MRIILTIVFLFLSTPVYSFNKEGISDSYSGIWKGDLSVSYAPKRGESNRKLVPYKISILENSVSLELEIDGEWFLVGQTEFMNIGPQGYFQIIKQADGWIEYWALSIIKLNPKSIYVYLTRTVNNFNQPENADQRHFVHFLRGTLNKE